MPQDKMPQCKWCNKGTVTEISKFEKPQKKAIKWIFNEQNHHYENEIC